MSTDPTAARAAAILAAADGGRSLPPVTGDDPGFGLPEAYRVAAEIRRLREARGERVVGRKIGFTNTTIWAQYAVTGPIWGYVYDTTLHRLADGAGPVALAPFVEPRIEPEIVFGLARAPEPGMDERALLGCIGWTALGFEIVQSLFPGWRFRAPDTAAAFGLHGALHVGEPMPVEADDATDWLAALRRFEVVLHRDGVPVETGRATNVLDGGPLVALRHLVAVLAEDPGSPDLAAGDVVTTGTLTNAYPIAAGECWTTAVSGLSVADLRIRF